MRNAHLVVVTGGTKGIGRAIIGAFSRLGFDTVTCSRNTEDLAQLKCDIEAEFEVSVHTMAADLSIKSDVVKFADFVQSINRPISVLVNNTGVFIPGEIHSEPEGVFEQQMNTNVYSAYYLSRQLIPNMKSRGQGHIFNICSTASNTAYTNGGSYCISKFALYGFSKVLREELKPSGIRVSSVLPGATLTHSWAGTDLPEERFMPADDVATMVVSAFQLSPRSVVEDIIIRPQLGDL